jgi:Tol biopolymer transport system component
MKIKSTFRHLTTSYLKLIHAPVFLLSAFLLVFCSTAYAQPQAAGDPALLISSEAATYLNPEWSPDGNTLAFTSANYDGIWLVDADGSNMRLLSTDSGIGFGFAWSPGGDFILGRASHFVNKRRYQDIKVIDTHTGDAETMINKARGIRTLPAWSQDGAHIAIPIGEDFEYLTTSKLKERALPAKSSDAVFAILDKLYFADAESRTESFIAGFDGRNIFGLSVSPDGEKAVFQVSGKGLHMINADGSGLQQLGFAEQATWTPDGKYIIATLLEDNGYIITSGELHAIDANTGEQFHLTAHTDVIAMNPSVSPCGKWVAFDNPDDGNIYIMEIISNF